MSPDPTSADLLELAESIARAAGAVVLDLYRDGVDVGRKHGDEPVTEADRAANELIVDRLKRELPADSILAEESGLDGSTDDARFWAVDPLDGTKEFIAQNGEFCLMIGLVDAGRPVLGVVYRPTDDLLYRGGPGLGASGSRGGESFAMGVSGVDRPSEMRLVMSRSHRDERFERMVAELGISDTTISGSVGLKAGLVASGACDLYLHPSRGTKLWDTAAPEAILAGAGGRMTDFDGEPIAYDPAHRENLRGVLVSNGACHERLVETLRPLFPGRAS